MRPNDDSRILGRIFAYLDKCPPAISGQNGHGTTFEVARALVYGFDLGADRGYQILWQHYNPCCQPPWSEKELMHKCQEADTKPFDKPRGYLLHLDVPGILSAATPAPVDPANPKPEPIVRSIPFDQIEPKAVTWLFWNRIPLGKVTVLDGDPDLGKSTLMLDIAARVTGAANGFAPDGTKIECGVGDVLILSGEDDPAGTIRPRLELAGAHLPSVHFLDEITEGEHTRPVEIPHDLPAIEKVIRDTAAKLVIIDPLMAFLCGVDANVDQSVRKALHQLSKVAARTRCAIVLQRHLNKSSNAKAIYRGGGSIAISAHARSALLVAEDPDDETKRLLAVIKKNRGGDAPTLRFCLDPVSVELAGQPDTICRIGWCGTSALKANDLVQAPKTAEDKEAAEEKKTKTELATELLKDLLRTGYGKVSCEEARDEAKAAGISQRTLEAAASRIGLKAKFTSTKEGRVYHWVPQADCGPAE
jgi:hypothetical protein